MAFVSQEFPDADFLIDYLDLLSAAKLLMPNADSLEHRERFVRENYKFNVLLQLELSSVNGISAVSSQNGQGA